MNENTNNDDSEELTIPEGHAPEGWVNLPNIADLKQNFQDAKPYHDAQMIKRTDSLDHLNITGSAILKKKKGKSAVQPKLIRKHAEWRYAAISEAFLSTPDMFTLHPRTHEDKLSAQQNSTLLNYQWNNQIDKVAFVDEFARTGIDEGTVFLRISWESEEKEITKEIPIYEYYPTTEQGQVEELQKAAMVQQQDPYAFKAHVPEHIQKALSLTTQQGQPIYPVLQEMQEVTETVLIKNQPTIEVCNSNNLVIDPSCEGNMEKAGFAVYSFETSKGALAKEPDRYFNLDKINVDTSSLLNAPDHEISGDSAFNFKDDPRTKFVAYEYWGYWDMEETGVPVPFVATWVNSVMVRFEENPYPDKCIPFVDTQYLPVRKSLYGEPDGALLKDNQAIIGAVYRGAIDTMARSAVGQKGMRQDALDVVNKRKYAQGEDYEFNPMVDPRQAMVEHTYPEIPNSVSLMIGLQNNEAESLTGVKPYSGGMSGDALGATATGIRGVLDAATKRETGILRRFARAMEKVAKKIVAMNGAFLSDEEIIRVTDEDFVTIRREDLEGNYDIEVSISTAEADDTKAQELAFMLQTMGNTLPMEMSQIVLGDIARLRKMPNLAKRIEEFKPAPDPVQEQIQQLELAKLQLELAELQAKTQKLQTAAQLDMAKANEAAAKAGNTTSDTDQKNLDFLEQNSGTKHAREMQQNQAQAKGNMALEILKADLNKDTPIN
jgi:hypothetical protein